MSQPILVWFDAQGDQPSRPALQAVQVARQVAAETGRPLVAVAAAQAADVAARYVPSVLRIDTELVNQDRHVRALQTAFESQGASMLIMAGTRSAQAILPRVALRVDGAFLEDVLQLEVSSGGTQAVRLSQLQRIRETLRTTAERVVVSVKIGAFEPTEPAAETGTVTPLLIEMEASDERVRVERELAESANSVSLDEAGVVIAGGRGLGSAEAFQQLLAPLSHRLGGAIGATRAAVDAGWRPYEEQIGQTGKTVAPDVYLALGVSGAVQHLSGMRRSRLVVAINQDADAPIFKHCDVGIVGDVHQVVPALLDALA